MPPEIRINSDSDIESVLSLLVAKPKVRRSSTGFKYCCSIEGCGQTFKRLDHLDRHEYKHTGVRKHACHYEGCLKAYSILTHLKRHLRTTHERPAVEQPKNVPCEVEGCDKMFTSVCNMRRHIREVHENPKVYTCPHCDEKFTQKLKMRRHEINKHTGVFPHKCEKCAKGFYQRWQWERHVASCKIYPCPTCCEQFEKWSVYLKHCKETQHGRKYYKCEHCARVYAKPGELQSHVAARHLMDDNGPGGTYRCTHQGCDRSYAYERNLRQHTLIAHGGKRFKCDHPACERVFSSSQNLAKHSERVHCFGEGVREDAKDAKPMRSMEKSKSLKRRRRKDAGQPLVTNLSKLSSLAIDKELDKQLRTRDPGALQVVSTILSQEMETADGLQLEVNGDERAESEEVVSMDSCAEKEEHDLETLLNIALDES